MRNRIDPDDTREDETPRYFRRSHPFGENQKDVWFEDVVPSKHIKPDARANPKDELEENEDV